MGKEEEELSDLVRVSEENLVGDRIGGFEDVGLFERIAAESQITALIRPIGISSADRFDKLLR
jgi:hypothetical protein